ncbi:membrane-associated proteins in eicosanoid and glutathione metabolism [Rhodofomes roseus]|uniref:Membrane-associated proteins in eicosanoid and glutathione metabolism n=1 Tax=Rhodofomes roseus TaxID=34475 RepID=A0ABQ8KPB5_9APHY|nr:membrane-associated proteins in eicosanoid and glutathione metabolism [Rhodofomes roseus]KAH9840273.1 membrane-associated proteins in eicosanoid and glutathione metabolism [Rhodofomes roseus]
MSLTVTISHRAIYPAAAIVSTFWLSFWQTMKAVGARKRAGIEYPRVYAEKAEAEESKEAMIFNCTQRAAYNTIEHLPVVITSTIITSVKYPVLAAMLCGIWSLCRFVYTIGYSTGDPLKRNIYNSGRLHTLAWLGLMCTASAAVVHLAVDHLVVA